MNMSRMVVMFVVAVFIRNVAITVNYIISSTDNNKEMVGEQFDDNITNQYHNDNDIVENDHDDIDIRYERNKRSDRKIWNEKLSIKSELLMSIKFKNFEISYPTNDYRFFKKMLDKDRCDQYTLECIYYRSEYPYIKLSVDQKTGVKYNPCHRFVEPCFGIPEYDYKKIKRFKNLRGY